MVNAHTHSENLQQYESMLVKFIKVLLIAQMLFVVIAFVIILNVAIIYIVLGFMALQVYASFALLFSSDGWRESWKDIKGIFHG